MSERSAAWLLLSRALAIAGAQAIVALVCWATGDGAPFSSAGRWWLVSVTVANVGTIALLSRLRREEGGVRRLWRFSRATWKGDLGWFVAFTVVAGPVGWLPNVALASVLWDAPDTGNAVLFRPLPLPVLAVLLVAFPVTQALAELPFYFGQMGPALRRAGWASAPSVLVPSLVLAVQHVAMPLEPDWRFFAWRGLMFLPFALLVGLVVYRRPTLLPWLLVVHALMDAQLPVLTWLVSTGALTFTG
ncbi:MAG: hypothetical protein JNJ54_14835 [Myxococcaceae bacterium]|nr:hypothetical protein [Myxococcaceae bacterium]